jgi:Uroporphyrinogen-III decarboxylase
MTNRENMLRAIRFERPDYIPMTFAVSPSCMHYYEPEAFCELYENHPILFPGYVRPKDIASLKKGAEVPKGRTFTDEFGVLWDESIDGIRGVVKKHPLDDWDNLASYKMPALPTYDIEKMKADVRAWKEAGHFTVAGLEHGHTFLRLIDLCGYENTICSLYDDDENMMKLLEMLEEYNYYFAAAFAEAEYDMVSFPEDLGMQVGPMLSPDLFRRHIKPSYQRLMKPARDAGLIVHMHSDGDIRDLADDLIDGGVQILNLQDLVNGIDWIKKTLCPKFCVDLDIDRQNVTVFGTPKEIDALIREEVEKLSSPLGGLTMIHGCYPGPPLENINTLMDAMERYMYYWD